jgi:hypothetical protein
MAEVHVPVEASEGPRLLRDGKGFAKAVIRPRQQRKKDEVSGFHTWYSAN